MGDVPGDPGRDLVVRVLGEPALVDDPAMGGRPLQVLVYLACRDTPSTTGQLMNAVWNGRAMARDTVKGAVRSVRRWLSAVAQGSAGIVTSRRGITYVRETSGIVTDFALLSSCRRSAAISASSDEAMDVLARGLAYVHGPPFDAPGYDWAVHTGMETTGTSLLIQDVATSLAELALNHGHVDLAREAIIQGLRGIPGDETLQRLRMEAERQAGNTAGIHAVYEEVVSFCESIETTPDPETTELYNKLMGRA